MLGANNLPSKHTWGTHTVLARVKQGSLLLRLAYR